MAAVAQRWIDPLTGDYVVENGGPRGDSSMASQVVLRLRTRRGSCVVMPTLGSRLHLITRRVPGADRLAAAYVREALDDLVERRSIRDLKVTVESVSSGGGAALLITVSFRDTSADQRSVRYLHRLASS